MAEHQKFELLDAPNDKAVEKRFISGAFSVPKNLQSTYEHIQETIGQNGWAQAASPYAKFVNLDWDEIRSKSMFSLIMATMFRKHEIVAGIPVEAANGDDATSIFNATKYLKFSHFGPVSNTLQSYKKAVEWADKNNMRFEDYSVESYVGIHRGEDMKTAETEIYLPVKST